MKICNSCGAVFSALADYCGECGTKLPEQEMSRELREDKDTHTLVMCESAFGHTHQLDNNPGRNFCTLCGIHLPIPPTFH